MRSNFSWSRVCIWEIQWLLLSGRKKRKNKKKKQRTFPKILIGCILRTIDGIFFNFGMWLSWVEGTSTVNLVPFRLDMELYICMKIVTALFLSVHSQCCVPPVFLVHTTHYRMSWLNICVSNLQRMQYSLSQYPNWYIFQGNNHFLSTSLGIGHPQVLDIT